LLRLFDDAVSEGFLHPENRALVLDADGPEGLLEKLAQFQPAHAAKWISRRTVIRAPRMSFGRRLRRGANRFALFCVYIYVIYTVKERAYGRKLKNKLH